MNVDLQTWKNRVAAAEKFRNRERDEKGWLRFIEEYEGIYRVGMNDLKVPPINLVFAYVHTEIPRLYFRDPYSTVNAKSFNYIKRAKLLEQVINYLKVELNTKAELEKTIIDALLVGHGWVKFGYRGAFGEVKIKGTERRGKKKVPIDEVCEFVKDEEIFVTHVPWEDIVFDPMAKDPPYDCRWIANAITAPLETIKGSSQFQNAGGLKANVSYKPESGDQRNKAARDLDMPYVRRWEIFDKDSGQVMTLVMEHDKWLRQVKNVYEMEGLPFSMLKFNRVPSKPYPLSDIFLIEPMILERIKLRAMELNHVKRWNRQMWIEKGSLEKSEKQKFELGVDGSVIEGNQGAKPPIVIQYAPIQAEIFQLEQFVQKDMDAVIGQAELERGGSQRAQTRTLGELDRILVSTASRSQKRQDIVEDFIEEVDRKIIELLKQFQTTKKYVRITGLTPAEVVQQIGLADYDGNGFSFTRDDIQGEYDVEVKAGSSIPVNKENRIKILESILKLGQFIGIEPGGRVAREVGKEILRDLNIKSAEKAFDDEDRLREAVPNLPNPVGRSPLQNGLPNGLPPGGLPPLAFPPGVGGIKP